MACTSKLKEHSEGLHHNCAPPSIADFVLMLSSPSHLKEKRANYSVASRNYSCLIKALHSVFMLFLSNVYHLWELWNYHFDRTQSCCHEKFVSVTVPAEINANGFCVCFGDLSILIHISKFGSCCIHQHSSVFSNLQRSSLTTLLT